MRPLVDNAVALGLENKTAESGKILMDEVQPLQRKIIDELEALGKHEAEETQKMVNASNAAYVSGRGLCRGGR